MKLKRMLGLLVILILPCSMFMLLGYRIGMDRGVATAKDWQRTTFITSLAALEDLKAGYVPAATKDMQQICFAHAHKVYNDPSFVDDHFVMFSSFRLVKYFDTYCTNRADWSREDKLLDKDLDLFRHR